jgi:hypothetical protein
MEKLDKVLYAIAVGLFIAITATVTACVIMWGAIQLAKLI